MWSHTLSTRPMSWSTSSIAVPLVDDPAQLAPELLALGGVEACAGLVEAYDAAARRPAPGPRRRACAPPARARRQPVEAPSTPTRLDGVSASGAAASPGGAFHRTSRSVAHRDGRAVATARFSPTVRSSKSSVACHVRARPLRARSCGASPDSSLAVERDAPARPHEAGDRVDEGRLARAVGADEPDHGALGDLELDVDERLHAAEAHRHALGPQRRGHRSLAVPAIADVLPAGR